MSRLVLTLAFATLLAGTSSIYAEPARAGGQQQPSRDQQLQAWIDAFKSWQQWWAQWANRPEPGMFTSSRPRRLKPEPPSWLAAECADMFDAAEQLTTACGLLKEWRFDNATAWLRAGQGAMVLQGEARPHSIWWEHLHVDLLWPATEARTSTYGVIGTHTAMSVKGRMQLFLAPGVMLLRVPGLDGRHMWKVAANYGFGYRLLDFNFPGDRYASLHVNIAKSWLISSEARELGGQRTVDFVGFSISFKRP